MNTNTLTQPKVYSFGVSFDTIMENSRKESVEGIYNKLSEDAKEYITLEDVDMVYKTLSYELDINLYSDEYGNLHGKYETEYFDSLVYKFMKALKAVKRGSNFSNWSDLTNVRFAGKYNEQVKYNIMSYDDMYKGIDNLYKDNKDNVRGVKQRNLITNLLFSAYIVCDNREFHQLVSKSEERKRLAQSHNTLSKMFNELKNK